jgi:hypothetical protein
MIVDDPTARVSQVKPGNSTVRSTCNVLSPIHTTEPAIFVVQATLKLV